MKHIIKLCALILGVLLMGNAIILAMIANFNIGLVFTFCLGALLFCYGLLFRKIHRAAKTGVFKWLFYLVVTGVLLTTMLIALLGVTGNFDTVTYREQALIVLGAGVRGETPSLPLVRRLQQAVHYYEKNKEVMIVVSGGQGFQEEITEALAMERYLVAKGIPKQNILKEEQATSTYENFYYSKQLLDAHFLGVPYQTAFITNDFHCYRAGQLAKIAGFSEVTHLGGKTEWYLLPVNYLRECAAVLQLWVFRR